MNKLLETKKIEPPWIIAHRGYRASYPENTLIAFKAAIDAGVPMIELDVTLSKDRQLVVIHDATLERTTNGRGPVNHHTLKQLKQLDAGGWFHPDYSGERIPELTEVLELTDGKVLINIEIKPHSYEAHQPPDVIEHQIVELIHQRKIEDFVLISSFDLNILRRLAQMNHSATLGLISRQPADRNTIEICNQIKAVSWHPNHQILSHDQVKKMNDASIKVFPYNADTSDEIDRMLGMEVDGVISSDPILAANRKVISNRLI
jgi:glycerophosphoryl diester phosphodiesterase